ncbi:hypothetical protein Ptr902_01910 [Pyrenophora tritici-repentis]|nr:hypothetical protein Ptr902_01910 [Pyrenophora tritici-repentis]
MSAIRAFATRRAPFVFVQRAAFSQSIARPVGKESALRTFLLDTPMTQASRS